jgi:hypothetical protein
MESLTKLLELVAAILVSLGGGAVIVLSFSNWLGKIWASKLMEKDKAEHAKELERLRNSFIQDTESYKIKLKKSEFLFEKEFAAASEFVAFVERILPRRHYPEMEWSDACDWIAMDFEKIEQRLDDYLASHGAVLSKEVIDHIGKCRNTADEGKFDVRGGEVGSDANKAANELYDELQKAKEMLLSQVHTQISI